MSADPQELNRRCAEALGWTEVYKSELYPDGPQGLPPNSTYKIGSTVGRTAIPNYCHDANIALLLVAELRKTGWIFHAESFSDDHWECNFFHDGPSYDSHFGAGPTFCLAIVNAFLVVREAGV